MNSQFIHNGEDNMLKRRNKKTNSEIYPGGRKPLPSAGAPPSMKSKKPTNSKRVSAPLPRITWRWNRDGIEKGFIITIFVVIEIMIFQVFFGIFESVFDGLNLPEMTRSVMKMAQLAMFIVFTYANIMFCFFKTNIFR